MLPPLAATTTRLRRCQWLPPRIGEHNPIQSVCWHCPRNCEAVSWHLVSALRGERVEAPIAKEERWCLHSDHKQNALVNACGVEYQTSAHCVSEQEHRHRS